MTCFSSARPRLGEEMGVGEAGGDRCGHDRGHHPHHLYLEDPSLSQSRSFPTFGTRWPRSSVLASSAALFRSLCAKLLMVRTMLQSTKTFDTKLVRYIEWSNVQPCVHHISPIWPHYGHFGPKNSHIWPYLAIGSPSCPKLVEHWLNMVEHRSPQLGWATWTPLHPPK